MEKRIETAADEMLMRLRREKRMSVLELEEALGVPRETIEAWVGVFEAKGLVQMVYPANPIEPPYVVIKDEREQRPAEEV